jgi:midasin
MDPRKTQPFKQLGDALEKFHRSHREIKEADKVQGRHPEQDKREAETARMEFQHLQDETAAADTQALGAAEDEEVHRIDDSMAFDNEIEDGQDQVLRGDSEEPVTQGDRTDFDEPMEPQDVQKQVPDETRSGVAIRQGAFDRDAATSPTCIPEAELEDQRVQETSTQLSTAHITDGNKALRDFSEALNLWSYFQTKTHPLSLALTSQLRLVLTPTQSTKLSGSFRTGKRLNIKRIIPYIASSYKRDKIWMRRSIPTKRAYQILLCVDDSKSMGETTSGNMALESLVMVSRALKMLEVGQVGVLGFGSQVFVAHELSEPYASHDAGARVLQHFTFEQEGTDICRLIRETINHFRVARLRISSRAVEDLWQLALVLSDGLTPSKAHEKIRPLLRQAIQERIMIVFIIMDDSSKKKGESVRELKEAKFTRDGQVVIERYLDSFPFQYYLIVHNLDDLPGALAGLLRTWFAEVNS